MIISTDEIMKLDQFKGQNKDSITRKLVAIESMIRRYTNNNFQNRCVRFTASSEGNVINGISQFFKVGDTIEVSESCVNDGLYIITEINSDSITVDKALFDVNTNLITKIEYPADVQEGVINLLNWEINNRDKVGIHSETLSRHSVTYVTQEGNNTIEGFPVVLMGFLKPYKKARF